VTRQDRDAPDLPEPLKDSLPPLAGRATDQGRDAPAAADAAEFDALIEIIEQARTKAQRAINSELLELYWRIGERVSARTRSEAWGRGTVARFSDHVQRRQPGIKGFSAVNIWRMRA
jgi:hypothetical protein